jgi:hypothetical protein
MAKTPENFKVDETVTRYVGEDKWDVKVVAVEGDAVTVEDGPLTITYAPRVDGVHVKVGSPDFEVMPDMIYHPKPNPAPQPKPVTLWQRITGKLPA